MKTYLKFLTLLLIISVTTTSCLSCTSETINDDEQIQANNEGNTEPQIPEPEPNP